MKNKAFSLIEMMLVIVVIATISVFFVNFAQQRSVSVIASNNAEKMQQWLQAAINYYETYNHWPDPKTDGGWTTLSGSNLLPSSAACTNLLTSNGGNSCGQYADIELTYPNNDYTKAGYVTVQIQIPGESIANKIASMLPNGLVNQPSGSNDWTVTGQVVTPGGLSPNQVYLVGSYAYYLNTIISKDTSPCHSSGFDECYVMQNTIYSPNDDLTFPYSSTCNKGSECYQYPCIWKLGDSENFCNPSG